MDTILPLLIDAALPLMGVIGSAVLAYLARVLGQYVGAQNAERARAVLEAAMQNAIAAYADNGSRVAYLRHTIPGTLATLGVKDDVALEIAVAARAAKG